MRRTVAAAVLVALVASLIVPGVALGRGGPPEGKGPGFIPPGLANKTAAPDASENGASEETGDDSIDSPSSGKARGLEKSAAGRAKAAEKATAGLMRSLEGTDAPEPPDSDAEDADENDAGKLSEKGKRHGIANALARIRANLERAEARVEAGEEAKMPPGLLRVFSKFLGWLDADPELDEVEPQPDATEPGFE